MKKAKVVRLKTKFGELGCLFEVNHPEKGYTVTVPDLSGIVTFGVNLKEAKEMVKEAIELHCECLFEEDLAEVKIRRSNDTAKNLSLTA